MLSCLGRLGKGFLDAVDGSTLPELDGLVPEPAEEASAGRAGPVLLGSGAAGKKGPALPSAALRRPRASDARSASKKKGPLLPIPVLRGGSAGGTLSTVASTPATGPLIPGLSCAAKGSFTPATAMLTPAESWKMFLEHGEEAQQLQDVYSVEEDVRGKGCFGTVRLARLISAPTVIRAVKSVPKRTLKAESIVRREVSVLRHLDHPCISRLHETFEDDRNIYLVMEFIDGRELFDEVVERGHLGERSAARVMQQVFGALKYCHERKIIHRDLKPENIMVQKRKTPSPSPNDDFDELEVKIIDFGLAVISAATEKGCAGSSVTGTFDYMAPEARAGRSSAAADLWSCGVVTHVLLAGRLPEVEVLMGDELLDLEREQYAALSQPARDLLLGLLRPSPEQRTTAAAASSHPWVAGCPGISPHDLSGTIDALTSFHRSMKLRRAALTALAMQLTGEQLGVLRERFMAIDTDGNGRISKEELTRSIAGKELLQGADEAKTWVESIFDAIDTDGSCEIEYTEWLSAAQLECAQRSEEDAWAAFRVFDRDGDGSIDQEEFARVLAQSPEEVADLLPQIDTNGDGVIDFHEFKRLLNVSKC